MDLPGSSVHRDSPGKNTGVGCHVLLQEIFLTQGSNSYLQCRLHYRWILNCWATREVCVCVCVCVCVYVCVFIQRERDVYQFCCHRSRGSKKKKKERMIMGSERMNEWIKYPWLGRKRTQWIKPKRTLLPEPLGRLLSYVVTTVIFIGISQDFWVRIRTRGNTMRERKRKQK